MSAADDAPDDFADFVLPSGSHWSSQALRETVLTQTTEVIRSRRRWKRIGLAAVLAGCYLAGMGTMSLWHSAAINSAFAHVPPELTAPVKPLVRPEDDHVDRGETQLAAAKLTPYDRLRQAGDRQLEVQNDIAAAVRTYRRALLVATAEQRAVSVDHDSWLLMTMKTDPPQQSSEKIP